MVRLADATVARFLPTREMPSVDSTWRETYATKQEGNIETQVSRDQEEQDRDSPKTAGK